MPRLFIAHMQQRQSLNEVENLYFHHSALKGKSKASRPSSSVHASALGATASPSTARGSPSKATSDPTKDGKVSPETNQAVTPVSVVLSPGAVATPSTPTVAASPHDTLPSQLSTPVKSPSSRSAPTPTRTPTQKQASDSAGSATHSPSVLSAFTQNYTAAQPLSRTATIDFSSLSPFVAASSLSSSSSSITAPSSFVSSVPPSPFATQTLAYMPSPFAPPPSTVPLPTAPSLPMSQFTAPAYPVVMPTSDMSASLATFPATPQATLPSLVQTQSHSPSPTPAPAPASTPILVSQAAPTPARPPVPAPSPVSKRIHSPAPASTPPSAQKPPPSASTHPHPHTHASLSSFRPSKTFDIPTAPGPVTSSVGTGTQSTTMLTYDSFWSSHSSSAGGWRRAIVSSNSSSGSTFTGGITPNPTASSAAGGGGLGAGGNSAKA